MKNTIIILIVIILVGLGGYLFFKSSSEDVMVAEDQNQMTDTSHDGDNMQMEEPEDKTKTVIGTSVEGRDIIAYHFPPTTADVDRASGEGDKEVLLVGGIHGGYSWNTSLLAYEMMSYFESSTSTVPEGVRVTVIPVLNPDGLYKILDTADRFTQADADKVTGDTVPGRFNANTVDLNRNFDCDWQEEGTWQNKKVSGGSAVFSEPESQAIRDYVEKNKPIAIVVYYSAAGGVYASNCHGGTLPETNTLTKLYSDASKYPAHQDFNFYDITGDMVNWLAKQNVPAISVLLTNHTDIELEKNKAGIKALLNHYAK